MAPLGFDFVLMIIDFSVMLHLCSLSMALFRNILFQQSIMLYLHTSKLTEAMTPMRVTYTKVILAYIDVFSVNEMFPY